MQSTSIKIAKYELANIQAVPFLMYIFLLIAIFVCFEFPLFEPALASNYNLRNECRLEQRKFKTYKYGYFSLQYFGSKLWNILPMDIKGSDNLQIFRNRIYTWCLSENADRALVLLNL